jgi:hypothetical protein
MLSSGHRKKWHGNTGFVTNYYAIGEGPDQVEPYGNIIEHPDVADAEPILRPAQSPQALDSATARFLSSCLRCVSSALRTVARTLCSANDAAKTSSSGALAKCGQRRTSALPIAYFGGSGAPRPTKMGTTRSPRRYDAAVRWALESASLRRPTILHYGWWSSRDRGGSPVIFRCGTLSLACRSALP